MLGCSTGTVKSQAAKALARLARTHRAGRDRPGRAARAGGDRASRGRGGRADRAARAGGDDREDTIMTPVDDQLRDLLRERAVPPAAPPGRTESVLRAARSRHRRRVAAATAATGLAVLAAVAVPVGLAARDSDPAPAAALPGPPPGSTPVSVTAVVAAGPEMRVALGRGGCGPPATGAAGLRDGSWRLAVWTVGARTEGRPCTDQYIAYTLKVPLSEPYAGQPVVDAASGRRIEVNGGPGFLVPTYLPAGYSLNPGNKDGLALDGPHGTIVLLEGGREIGTVRDYPGWPYDVLDRPDISGNPGLLIRYRNDGDNTMLRWLAGDRGVSLQVFSATLDPQELVRIARGLR